MAEGTKVVVGLRGFSAADIARQQGFDGDDTKWVESLEQGARDQKALAEQAAVRSDTSANDSALKATEAELSRFLAEEAAARAVAPTDTMNADLIKDRASKTAKALNTTIGDQNAAQVPPLVSQAIAADRAVADAAAEAVGDAIISLDILEGGQIVETNLAFAIVDEDGRRTWIEVDGDGKPTEHSAKAIQESLDTTWVEVMDTPTTNLAFAIVDEDGRRTDLEVGADGKFTSRVVQSLRERMNVIDPEEEDPDVEVVVTSGDSLTGGSGGVNYPTQLANLTGWTVINYGVGGETSSTISGRLGGRPMLASFLSGEIPETATAAPVILTSDNEHTRAPGSVGRIDLKPLYQQRVDFNPVIIAGVSGALELTDRTAGTYSFTRTVPGEAVSVNYPTPLSVLSSRKYRKSIHVMWWGHNDGLTSLPVADVTEIIGRYDAMIETLEGPNPRWLILGLAQHNGEWRRPGDLQFTRAYGRRFINVGEYLSSLASFADAGLVPTEADFTSIGSGSIPPSMRIDGIHLTEKASGLVANLVDSRIREMGWKA